MVSEEELLNYLHQILCRSLGARTSTWRPFGHLAFVLDALQVLDTQVSLAPTHVSPSVRWSIGFPISILSASLVALHEKLKKTDLNFFSLNFGSRILVVGSDFCIEQVDLAKTHVSIVLC